MREINVVITMDCERPTTETHPSASGPPDYEKAEAWTRAYADLAAESGFPVTFFIHPEVAHAKTALFQEFEAHGACLGLHLHPWRFGHGRYKAELGGLTEKESAAVVFEATDVWESAFGRRSLCFRAGALSANDSTFRVLTDLGFRGGSNSSPGRVFPDIYSVWASEVPDPHRAHSFFRQLEGDLEFVEMPFSVDFSTLVEKAGRWLHRDLRPDYDYDHRTVAVNILNQVKARAPAVPVINMVTHNDHDFTDPHDRVFRNFRAIFEAIPEACETAELHPIGATLDTICRLALERPIAGHTTLNLASGKVYFQEGEQHEYRLASHRVPGQTPATRIRSGWSLEQETSGHPGSPPKFSPFPVSRQDR